MMGNYIERGLVKCDIEMKNKETLFCEPAQRTKSYVTGEQKGVDTVIRSIARFCKMRYLSVRQGSAPRTATLIYKA